MALVFVWGSIYDTNRNMYTFCTLILWLVLLKIKLALIAFANLLAFSLLVRPSGKIRKLIALTHLDGYFLLILPRKVYKMIVLGANQERNCRLIESTALSIPLLDRVERAFPGEIKHKQYRNGIITNQREHINEFSLSAQIPNRESDFGVSN